MTISTLSCPKPSLKPLHYIRAHRIPTFTFGSSSKGTTSLKNLQQIHNFSAFPFRRNIRVASKAENGENVVVGEAEEEARGQSTMPERFRYLAKEAPNPPVRWPYFIALFFLIYAWRAVIWELFNWKKAVVGITHFLGYLLKLTLALIFHFIGDPVTSLIRVVETGIYTVRSFYSGIVAYAPIPELTTIIMLASATLSIAEAAVPDSVNSQPYLLTLAGLIGFAAVKGLISEPFFWALLLGLFGFSRFAKKRDYVTSALPAATVLAAIGEPWVRVIVMASYLALAITHHSKQPSEGDAIVRRVPIPLLCAALAIGIRVAAKWAGRRHLTWMIV